MEDQDVGMSDSGASDDSSASPLQAGEAGSSDVTIPMDLLPGCKVGDTYTVKSTDNNEVTLEATPSDDDSDDWATGATDAMKGAE